MKDNQWEEKFKRTVELNGLLHPRDRIVVGVSGGPDSMGLLSMLCFWREEWKLQLIVAHLNHGMREEAERDFALVRDLCSQWKLTFMGGRVQVESRQAAGSISKQEEARKVRYWFYERVANKFQASKVALAHHRDDQVETVMLNFLHGSGLDGLSGMQMKRSWKGKAIIRPLLNFSHREMVEYCHKQGVPYVLDETNVKNIYRRNLVRQELLPYLKQQFNPRIKESIHRMSGIIADDRDYLEKIAARYFNQITRFHRGQAIIDLEYFKELHIAVQRRLLRKAYRLTVHSGAHLDSFHVDRLVQLGTKGATGKQQSLPGKGYAYKTSKALCMAPLKKKTPFQEVSLKIPGITYLYPTNMAVEAKVRRKEELTWPPSAQQVYLDYDKLKEPLYFRTRLPGDRFIPLGMASSKKLKEFFIDQKVPMPERDFCPLLISSQEIAWVAGYRIAEPYKVEEDTRRVLVLKLYKNRREGTWNE